MDSFKNFTVVMVFSAKYFLHKIPLLVPGSAIIFEELVKRVVDGVEHFKLPLSYVFLDDFNVFNEAVSRS